jgi:hypothetical protein
MLRELNITLINMSHMLREYNAFQTKEHIIRYKLYLIRESLL